MPGSEDLLFEYLRQMLYETQKAELDITDISPEMQKIAQGMQFLAQCLKELSVFTEKLSVGDLSGELPPSQNPLAFPLKKLHASLKHLTWQSQQVAKGDYSQKLDFMGDFAEAFNSMTLQLAERQTELEQEIERTKQASLALEQNNTFLMNITDKLRQWIIVTRKSNSEIMFINKAVQQGIDSDIEWPRLLYTKVFELINKHDGIPPRSEIEICSGGQMQYFNLESYPMKWNSEEAVAHSIIDVSVERKHILKLESYAFHDSLTGLFNRAYGMQELARLTAQKCLFSICFIDADNLKFVNDTYGHDEGDDYILSIANAITGFEENSIACRIGGDEFMILVPERSFHETLKRICQVRTALINRKPDSGFAYTRKISYGIVQASPSNTLPASDLLAIADERMYKYKRASKKRKKGIKA